MINRSSGLSLICWTIFLSLYIAFVRFGAIFFCAFLDNSFLSFLSLRTLISFNSSCLSHFSCSLSLSSFFSSFSPLRKSVNWFKTPLPWLHEKRLLFFWKIIFFSSNEKCGLDSASSVLVICWIYGCRSSHFPLRRVLPISPLPSVLICKDLLDAKRYIYIFYTPVSITTPITRLSRQREKTR